MSITVTVRYEGAGTLPALRVKDPSGTFHRLNLQGGKATYAATAGAENVLYWSVLGSPGTKYTITLSVPKGSSITAAKNPLNRVVPAGEFSFGRMAFTAQQEKETTP